MGLNKTEDLVKDLLVYIKYNKSFTALDCQENLKYDRTALYRWLKIFVQAQYLVETKIKNTLYYTRT